MVVQSLRRALARGIEWPTVTLIAGCYGVWVIAGFAVWPDWPLVSLLLLSLAVALHSSICHEVLHGHPTRDSLVNEAFVFLPLGVIWPYRRFKAIHLRHHADERLTDPFDDPESYYRALWQYEAMPEAIKLVLRVNNTLLGRLVLGPPLGLVGLVAGDLRAIREGDRNVARAWALHLAGLAVVLPVVQFGFGMPVWLYLLVPVWIGHSIIAIRTYAEHQWSETPEGRTIIVERSPLAFFFLNNNLHLVHHKLPTVPWYRLPAQFRARRAEWIAMNGGYVFPNYRALLSAYLFKAKEPVVHPVLRRSPEPGRAFRPRVAAHRFGGLGATAVPAEPPRE
ncbi:MAG: fatty acid desaturase [Rhizobiaceae bacterium]|nr:fatty acid desaturase [Rhizobiaceae bacterium]MCV0406646.1 fatty acid desaturase [Rhizobiaceae bacterium]